MAKGPDQIEVVPVNEEAKDTCSLIEEELRQEGPGSKEYRISRV